MGFDPLGVRVTMASSVIVALGVGGGEGGLYRGYVCYEAIRLNRAEKDVIYFFCCMNNTESCT